MAKHLAENNVKTVGGESIIGTGDISLPAKGTLQSITTETGSNITSNAIRITGDDNYGSRLTGGLIYYKKNNNSLIISSEEEKNSTITGMIDLKPTSIELQVGSTTFRMSQETASTEGVMFNSRVVGQPAENSNNFVTKSQHDTKLTKNTSNTPEAQFYIKEANGTNTLLNLEKPPFKNIRYSDAYQGDLKSMAIDEVSLSNNTNTIPTSKVVKENTVKPLTVVTDGSLSIDKNQLNIKFPDAVKGDRYINNPSAEDIQENSIMVECLGNGEWWVMQRDPFGYVKMGIA